MKTVLSPSDDTLLEHINAALAFLGQTSRYKRLPGIPAELAPLDNHMLVMVDDTPDVLAAFVPYLITATRGKAAIVLHKEQDVEQLADETYAHAPDTVLMDYHLAGDLRGDRVVQRLQERTSRALSCIGFSATSSTERFFRRIGSRFVTKNAWDPTASLAEVAKIVAETLLLSRRSRKGNS